MAQSSEEEKDQIGDVEGNDEIITPEVEKEEAKDEVENEDMTAKEEMTDDDKDSILSAFLQVSEPALVSSHHDGFLRFWNLSVS